MQRKTIRGVAWLDMAITLPFAMPFIAETLIAVLAGIDRELGFGTPAALFDTGPLAMMFVNIMGVLGVVWALARLHTASPHLSGIDAVARLVVAALIIYAVAQGATPLLWLFVLTEVGGSTIQFVALRNRR